MDTTGGSSGCRRQDTLDELPAATTSVTPRAGAPPELAEAEVWPSSAVALERRRRPPWSTWPWDSAPTTGGLTSPVEPPCSPATTDSGSGTPWTRLTAAYTVRSSWPTRVWSSCWLRCLTRSGAVLVPVGEGVISCTPVGGRSGGGGRGRGRPDVGRREHHRPRPAARRRLHRSGSPSWSPLVEPEVGERLARPVASPGRRARTGSRPDRRSPAGSTTIEEWTTRYLALAEAAGGPALGGDPRRDPHPQPASTRTVSGSSTGSR